MKNLSLTFISLSLLACTVTMAGEIEEEADDIPCTCVFNKNRDWNPDKVLWNDGYWECSNYKTDGTCSQVRLIKTVSVDDEVVVETEEANPDTRQESLDVEAPNPDDDGSTPHLHGERAHTHPLPEIGIAHTHGSLAAGEAIPDNHSPKSKFYDEVTASECDGSDAESAIRDANEFCSENGGVKVGGDAVDFFLSNEGAGPFYCRIRGMINCAF